MTNKTYEIHVFNHVKLINVPNKLRLPASSPTMILPVPAEVPG